MDAIGVLMGVLVAIGLFIAIRNRYWGKPKQEYEKMTMPVSDPLLSTNWQDRLHGVHALSNAHTPDNKRRLLLMLSDKDEDVREAARAVLLTYGDEACEDFIHVLQHGENHDARCEAAIGLRAYSCDDVLDALLETLKDDSRFVRLAVIESLTLCKDSRINDALKSLANDEDSEIRSLINTLVVTK